MIESTAALISLPFTELVLCYSTHKCLLHFYGIKRANPLFKSEMKIWLEAGGREKRQGGGANMEMDTLHKHDK